MKNLSTIVIILLFTSCMSSFAQKSKTDTVAKQAISKLNFITGKWSGKGWIRGQDGKKHSFQQTEDIAFKLDSTALLIEGLGKSGKQVMHRALAIVTYNRGEKNYNFRSYLANGQHGVFKGELKDGKFYWYPQESMRYIITLNEKEQWYEIGEMKNDRDWFQFFEMTLNKKK